MPFELNPNPKFLWLGEKYKEGLAAVRYGIQANAGFLSLTGDVGTGKTTLVNTLANSLGNNIIIAKILNPRLKTLDFFKFLANALKINEKFDTEGDFLLQLKSFLHKAHAARKKVFLIIDEAQGLSQALLEEVRLLSNIEKQNQKLINILFVGQNEFNTKLKNNRALRHRVIISYKIKPLTEIETEAYIRHRLKIAGSKTDVFSQNAIHEVYAFSKGNPRLINGICDLALLSGYLKEAKIIEPQIIKDCALEYEIPDEEEADFIEGQNTLAESIRETDESSQLKAITPVNRDVSVKTPVKPRRRRAAYLAAILPLIFLGIIGYLYYFSENHASVAKLKPLLQQSLSWFKVSQSEPSYANTQVGQAAAAANSMKMLSDNRDRAQNPVPESNEDMLSKFEQRLNELEKDLDHEKNSKAQSSAELASKDALVAELKVRNDTLVTEIEDLKGDQERLAALETDVEQRDQTLTDLENRLKDLVKVLNQEKSTKDKLTAELSAKTAQAEDLQQKLNNYQTDQVELESEMAGSKAEISQLKGELSDYKTKEVAAIPSPIVDNIRQKPQPMAEAPITQTETTSPETLIDWVLKKKSE